MLRHLTLLLILFLVACGSDDASEETPNYPIAGTVISESCDGTTLIQEIADGLGGSSQQETPESEQCGYVAPPAEGTILDEFCENFTYVTITADGNGGEIREEQDNAAKCGYVPPPEAGTILDEYCEEPYTKVVVTADGMGGEIVERTEDSQDCGAPQFAPYGEPQGMPYCANSLAEDRFLQLLDTVNHFLNSDLLQDYADGEGGTYTERVEHISQQCLVQMEPPPECPTDATDTDDSRYDYMTCDGIKQRTSTDFAYADQHEGTAVVDILVVYDTKLTHQDRGERTRDEFILDQIFHANHMFEESGADIALRLVGIIDVNVEPGDLYRQYRSFFNARDEFADLDKWQLDANADIAFLFKKIEEEPLACGVAQLDGTRGLQYTRGITQCYDNSTFQEAENTRYYERANETFVHEVGHIFGLEHEKEDAGLGLFEYSYGYNLPGYNPQKANPEYEGTYGGYGTIMSYADLATGRFSDPTVSCTFPEEAGEYAGKSVQLGTNGGCFCLDPIEEQPPETNAVEHLRRVRWVMSQLAENDHELRFNVPVIFDQGIKPCLF